MNHQGEPSTDTSGRDFDQFWAVYPRRIGKGQAVKAYAAARKVASAGTILEGAQRYAAFVAEQKVATQYQPHPSTWLNGLRWDDDLQVDRQARRQAVLAGDVHQDGSWANTGDGGWDRFR